MPRIAAANRPASPRPSSSNGVRYTRIVNTTAPVRGSRLSVCRSTRRRIRSGIGGGGVGRGVVRNVSSGPTPPSAHASSSRCVCVCDSEDEGGRTWMSQLVRDTGVSGARRRKKRVSDGWSFSSSASMCACTSAACQTEIRVCDERVCDRAGGW
jgi:hypothetical protein